MLEIIFEQLYGIKVDRLIFNLLQKIVNNA